MSVARPDHGRRRDHHQRRPPELAADPDPRPPSKASPRRDRAHHQRHRREDALKYLPSLLVRKRYIGDYNHAVLSTRASGTGNSARSAVYADGILLSNYLGNGATFAPRWGMVTPEEIERVDVLYGPFSAAYGGNSVGAVVDYVTRMPRRFEAHAKARCRTSRSGSTTPTTAIRAGRAACRSATARALVLVHRPQPQRQRRPAANFVTRLLSAGVATAPDSVTGAVPGQDRSYRDWLILGTPPQYHTVQDHLKAKLAYDFSPTLRATYVLGLWQNEPKAGPTATCATAASPSTAAGLDWRAQYTLGQTGLQLSNEDAAPRDAWPLGQSNTKGSSTGNCRQPLRLRRGPAARRHRRAAGGLGGAQGASSTAAAPAGTPSARKASGAWTAMAAPMSSNSATSAKPTSSPASNTHRRLDRRRPGRAHPGFRRPHRTQASTCRTPGASPRLEGRARPADGALADASDGRTSNATATVPFPNAARNYASPKAALAWQATPSWVLKASLGRAVRMPTVSELYQGGVTGAGVLINNDPDLARNGPGPASSRPSASWTRARCA
jgi:iron complex outermembrane receptor protein